MPIRGSHILGKYSREDCARDIAICGEKLDRVYTRLTELEADIQRSFADLQRYQNTILVSRRDTEGLREAVLEFRKENTFLGYLREKRDQYDSLKAEVEKRKSDLEWLLGTF